MENIKTHPQSGLIAYLVDGKEVSRADAFAAWRARDTSATFQGCEYILVRAEDTDGLSGDARAALARRGITVHHLTPSAAAANARRSLPSLKCVATASTKAPSPLVQP